MKRQGICGTHGLSVTCPYPKRDCDNCPYGTDKKPLNKQ